MIVILSSQSGKLAAKVTGDVNNVTCFYFDLQQCDIVLHIDKRVSDKGVRKQGIWLRPRKSFGLRVSPWHRESKIPGAERA